MIISHKHRFIFFAVPKTATHAIREALRVNLGSDDWEQQFLLGEQTLPIAEIARVRHGHISAQQIRPHLPNEVWQNYFKFGFVRNPFDRYVSTCFFLNRNNPAFSAEADSFMRRAITIPRFRQRVLVKPQYFQLANPRGEIALDYVGRYEDLQQSYDEICARLGLPSAELPIKNTSEHATFTDYYDDELRDAVAGFYQDDLRAFDYAYPARDETD